MNNIVGLLLSKKIFFTWWYVRREWNLAASLVGGNLARFMVVLAAALVNIWKRRSLRFWDSLLPPYSETRKLSPASVTCSGVALGFRKTTPFCSRRGCFFSVDKNFIFPWPKSADTTVSQPLKAWRNSANSRCAWCVKEFVEVRKYYGFVFFYYK